MHSFRDLERRRGQAGTVIEIAAIRVTRPGVARGRRRFDFGRAHDARVAVAQVKQAEGYFMPVLTAVAEGNPRRTNGGQNTLKRADETLGKV